MFLQRPGALQAAHVGSLLRSHFCSGRGRQRASGSCCLPGTFKGSAPSQCFTIKDKGINGALPSEDVLHRLSQASKLTRQSPHALASALISGPSHPLGRQTTQLRRSFPYKGLLVVKIHLGGNKFELNLLNPENVNQAYS